MPRRTEADVFDEILDTMIESTHEFIRDDQITWDNDPDNRLRDILALNYVRDLWKSTFRQGNDGPVELDLVVGSNRLVFDVETKQYRLAHVTAIYEAYDGDNRATVLKMDAVFYRNGYPNGKLIRGCDPDATKEIDAVLNDSQS